MFSVSSAMQENADMEWRFARSTIWMGFFERRNLLPNPFTIIPTVRDIMDLLEWLAVKIRRPKDKKAMFSRSVKFIHIGYHCFLIGTFIRFGVFCRGMSTAAPANYNVEPVTVNISS